jgi:tRNA pseudouridine38-40 synthase
MMKRYAIELTYNGSHFYGWQRQPRETSVQEVIEIQLSKLNAGKIIPIVGCGRTDTGVHASYYVAHFDLEQSIDTKQWQYKLNKMLPNSIAILGFQEVDAAFHARFSATQRTYHYFVHQKKDPFQATSLFHPQALDVEAMNRAAQQLLGTQDFTSFSKLHTDVKTNICTISNAKWYQQGEKWFFEITADRFLRNMVRAVVGTLLEVGQGKISEKEITTIIQAQDRGAAKLSVPAHALFLCDIKYPETLFQGIHLNQLSV